FILVALCIFVVYMGIVALLHKNPVRERLKRLVPVSAIDAGFIYDESKSPLVQFCGNVLAMLGVDLTQARRDQYYPLARAGLVSTEALVYYLFFLRVVQPVLFILGVVMLLKIFGVPADESLRKVFYLLVGALLLVIGSYGAKLYLRNRTIKRQAVLEKSFADALDLLLVCVESGLPLDGALARVCRELKRAHPEITAELDRLRVELNVLNDRGQALQNLAERTNTHGFKTLVAFLMQTEKFGTSIADTLRVLADEFRTSRMMVAETKAARIPALITVPLIFFILPAFMLIIMAPPVIKIKLQGGLFPTSNSR
ncbi:MAG: type II secretion system F family protein, partial [Alphaproteobacteria bacterium]|nr:type II secretion system F family protein [Alphaproteobacteria bacterium]